LRNLRILIVDDDPIGSSALVEMLRGTGAQLRGTPSVDEAIAIIEESWPQVLLCDIAAAGEAAYSFIRRVRACGPGRGGDVPALALTAIAGEEDRLRALSAGFQMHVAKPVDTVRLTRAVIDLSQLAPAGAARRSIPTNDIGR
jgi:CheY-like chemotaxis protein